MSLPLVFPGRLPHFEDADFYRVNMQPGTRQFLRFLGSWAINTLAVALTVIILRKHISYDDKVGNLLMVSFLLGILNAFVRPILILIALPLLIVTLGLFTLVINALLLRLISLLLPFFHVDGFGYAFAGAALISILSMALNALTGMSSARVTIQHRPRPPRSDKDDGPVIDV